jgi:CBS domain-containing protein
MAAPSVGEVGGTMKVAEIMQTQVLATEPESLVVEAITTLADSHVSGLPVVDKHGTLVGVLSTSDILNAIAETSDSETRERMFEGTQVQELMSRQPMTVEPDASLKDAAERMLYLDVHRLFVVEDGQLVGVISQSDIARTVATSKA